MLLHGSGQHIEKFLISPESYFTFYSISLLSIFRLFRNNKNKIQSCQIGFQDTSRNATPQYKKGIFRLDPSRWCTFTLRFLFTSLLLETQEICIQKMLSPFSSVFRATSTFMNSHILLTCHTRLCLNWQLPIFEIAHYVAFLRGTFKHLSFAHFSAFCKVLTFFDNKAKNYSGAVQKLHHILRVEGGNMFCDVGCEH